MSWTVMLILQAVTPSIAIDAKGFDLRGAVAGQDCQSENDDIVVCGSRRGDEKYRLRELPAGDFEPEPLRATTRLGGNVTGSLHGDSQQFPGGITSRRVMITIKTPF